MLEALQTLATLKDGATMSQAGLRLRISQSAVSKRIAALEAALGLELVSRDGRRAGLTPAGAALLRRAMPLLTDLDDLFEEVRTGQAQSTAPLTLGIPESVLASWGARALAAVKARAPALKVEPHIHRGPEISDKVAAGALALGIIAGVGDDHRGALTVEEIAREPMVLVRGKSQAPGARAKDSGHGGIADELISIEERSGTWEAIGRRARNAGLTPTIRVESFFGAAALARAGLGDALIPLGVAVALGIKKAAMRPAPGRLSRPISLVRRRRSPHPAAADQLVAAFREVARASFGD